MSRAIEWALTIIDPKPDDELEVRRPTVTPTPTLIVSVSSGRMHPESADTVHRLRAIPVLDLFSLDIGCGSCLCFNATLGGTMV